MTTAVELARDAFARRSWREGFDAFSEAVEAGAALRSPRQQRIAGRFESRLPASDAPRLFRGNAPLRRVVHQIGGLRRPDGGVVDRLVPERPAPHGFQPTSGF
jgi:hypothetical protein